MQVLLTLLLLLAGPVWAAPVVVTNSPQWRALREQSNRALLANDCVAARKLLLQLQPLMPGNPRSIYNLAACNARLGARTAALQGLQRLAHMGLAFDLANDPDFAALAATPELDAILARMAGNRAPQTRARPAFKINEPDLLPESLALDQTTGRWFISSVRQAKIITADGRLFAKTEWSAFALGIDQQRRLLWATTGDAPQCADCARPGAERSALLAFDLDSGALRHRIDSPTAGLLGDMLVAPDGDVFVSESLHGAVFRLRAGALRFDRLDADGEFLSPQTPALSADGHTLFVPDYVRGLAAIKLATGRLRWLQPSDQISLVGVDGLYVYRGDLLAVQNGVNPERLLRVTGDLSHQQVLEQQWPGLGEITHGTIVGDCLYFLANTGWDSYDQRGVRHASAAPVLSSVWVTPLTARANCHRDFRRAFP